MSDVSRSPWKKRAIVLAALAFGTALAARSSAAGEISVVLIGPSATHPTVVRVKQELSLLGVDVIVVLSSAKGDLGEAARAHDAAAAARVEDAPPEIVLWVDAAHSAGMAQESRVSDSLSGGADPGLLALRAVELLRGRLLPVPPSESATASTATAPSATTAPSAAPSASVTTAPTIAPIAAAAPKKPAGPDSAPSPRPSRGSVHLGPAIVASPGGVPVAPVLRLGAGYRVIAPLEVSALLMVPLTSSTVSATEGAMDLRALAGGVGANIHVTRPESAFSLHAGAGMGVAAFFYDGRATAPWVSASGARASAMPYLEGGGGYRITPAIGLRADILAALVRPEPVLVIAGRSVASFGSPLVLASIALEVHP